MLKKVLVVTLVVFIGMTTSAVAQEQEHESVVAERGEVGYFTYNTPAFRNEIIVWEYPVGTRPNGGKLGCQLTEETEIEFLNEELMDLPRRDFLSFLNGDKMFMFAKVRHEGRGEGSRTICLKVTLFRFPDTN